MRILARRPRGPLAGCVDLLWHAERGAPAAGLERVLPSGTAQLILQLGEGPLRVWAPGSAVPRDHRGAVIAGPHSRPFRVDTSRHEWIMGAHFRPGGLFPFLPDSAGELHNRHLELQALCGAGLDELRERLRKAPMPRDRLEILERFLARRALRPLAPDPRVAFALREFRVLPRQRSVSGVADRAGLGTRAFARLFRARVGLTPKLFCRVHRFQTALRLIEGPRPIRWTEVALACGYFDQAHLIRDFKAFAGLTPGAYRRRGVRHRNHVPGDP